MLSRTFLALVVLTLAVPLVLSPTPLVADEEGKPEGGEGGEGEKKPEEQKPPEKIITLAEFEEQMASADEAGKVKALEAMAKNTEPEGAKAVAKHMADRSLAVRVAAIRTVGLLQDKASFGKLNAMVKSEEKEPKVLAAVVQAIGEYANPASMKMLVDVAKKWMFKDSEVSSAAAYGLGKIRQKAAVDELIKLMDLTYPGQASSGPGVSTETRDLLAKSRPAIISALQELTGWDFRDAPAWKRFWDLEQKTWKPAEGEPDYSKLAEWRDPGYGFTLPKPAKNWVFDRTEKAYRILMKVANDENIVLSQVYVMAYENTSGMTPEQKAQEYEDSFSGSWKDIKKESWVREDCRVGKLKGFTHSFSGIDAYGQVARARYIYVLRGEMMFILGSWTRSGIPKEVQEQVDKAFSSFKILE